MANITDIANRALVICGQEQVTAVTQGTGKIINDAQDYIFNQLLELYPWVEYQVRYESSSPTDVSSSRKDHPWRHAFPSDYFRLLDVELSPGEWAVEGSYLYTTKEEVHYVYINLPTSFPLGTLPSRLEPVFAHLMAMHIVNQVTQSRFTVDHVRSEAERFITRVVRNESIQNPHRKIRETSWLESRL